MVLAPSKFKVTIVALFVYYTKFTLLYLSLADVHIQRTSVVSRGKQKKLSPARNLKNLQNIKTNHASTRNENRLLKIKIYVECSKFVLNCISQQFKILF